MEELVNIRMVKRHEQLAEEYPVEVADIEVAVRYCYSSGPWVPSPGSIPRT